jgi:hypothetical protein
MGKRRLGKEKHCLTKFEIFCEKILYIKNVLPNSLSLINTIEEHDDNISDKEAIPKWENWSPSLDNNFFYGKIKISNYKKIETSSDVTKYIFNEIYKSIDFSISLYKKEINSDIGNFGQFGICKYVSGKGMGKHVDVDPSRKNFKETVSGVLYMNDNYIGGEIFFEDQDVLIKPESGSIVIFPSTPPFFHESKVLKSGTKYICTVFCSK